MKINFEEVNGTDVDTASTKVTHFSTTGSNENTIKVEVGDAFGGTYLETILGSKYNPGSPMSHKFESEDGELFTIPASGLLNKLISSVSVGDKIACLYEGKVQMKDSDSSAHVWKIKKLN